MKKFEYFRIVFYILGVIGLILVAAGQVNIPCSWKENFNITCASCGMTRATKSILMLNFKAAFGYHALFTGVFFPLTVIVLLNDLYVMGKRHITGKEDISFIEIVCGYAKNERN